MHLRVTVDLPKLGCNFFSFCFISLCFPNNDFVSEQRAADNASGCGWHASYRKTCSATMQMLRTGP